MIVFTGICPHTPLLIPSVGKESLEEIKKTQKSLIRIGKEIKASGAFTIVVISPHSDVISDAFSININTEYTAAFKEFGAIETKTEYSPDAVLGNAIYDNLHSQYPISLYSREELDHGASVPLYYGVTNCERQHILPIYVGHDISIQQHEHFGRSLFRVLEDSPQKIAVLAAADLSHTLTDKSPSGFHRDGQYFDETIQELFEDQRFTKVTEMKPKKINNAATCGYLPLVMFAGLMDAFEKPVTYTLLSYEYPFGVGYFTAYYTLK